MVKRVNVGSSAVVSVMIGGTSRVEVVCNAMLVLNTVVVGAIELDMVVNASMVLDVSKVDEAGNVVTVNCPPSVVSVVNVEDSNSLTSAVNTGNVASVGSVVTVVTGSDNVDSTGGDEMSVAVLMTPIVAVVSTVGKTVDRGGANEPTCVIVDLSAVEVTSFCPTVDVTI